MVADYGKRRKTASGIALNAVYDAHDVTVAHQDAINAGPGSAPFLRGAYPKMYRERPWRIFQLSGFGNPVDENARIKFLLNEGENGFIMEHDRNTADHLYDVDHPDVVARRDDVGLTGAVIMSRRDFETVLEGVPIDCVYGHPGGGVVQHAPFALACYWTVARQRGIDLARLSGTGQSDYFLTYLACVTKQQVPTLAGLRFNCDIIEFCADYLPHWVPVSIAGYNGADTGLNAYQELGATFANAIEYLDEIRRRGRIPLESAAWAVAGVSFRVAMDLFEEIAKLRIARKIWADLLRSRYGITSERAARLRIHVVTAGSAMTYQQPLNNIARGALMGLAAVLGGVQSLGVSGYDEALSIPSEHAHQMSVRIQQILQQETNVTAVVDPLGGAFYLENLCSQIEERTWSFLDDILDQGGFLATLDSGWLHARAHENQFGQQQELESGDRCQVGVNAFDTDVSPYHVDGFIGTSNAFDEAMGRLERLRMQRDASAAARALAVLETSCRGSDNLMQAMMAAVEHDVTLGEVGEVFRRVYGDWETPVMV